MHYVGQKVMCINGEFDAGIEEWADHLPETEKIYTVRCCVEAPDHVTGELGLCYKLLELPNPKTDRGGEVCFSVNRFELIGDDLETVVMQNRKVLVEEHGGYVAGLNHAFFGSHNETGRLSDTEINLIVRSLVLGGIIITEMEKVHGSYDGRSEESLKAGLVYSSFSLFFAAIQKIRAEMRQDAVGLLNTRGIYIRITADTLLCQGPTYVVYGPSVKVKPDMEFDPDALGFMRHKDCWIVTNLGEKEDEIGNLPRALQQHLDAWEAFFIQPGDDISCCHPEWIEAAVSVDPKTFLIWHSNQAITDAGGPYIRILQHDHAG